MSEQLCQTCKQITYGEDLTFCSYVCEGIMTERERIIKLLEKHTHPGAEAEYLIDCDLCERYYGVGLAIALIEGEQK